MQDKIDEVICCGKCLPILRIETSVVDRLNGRRIYPFNKGLRIYRGVYHLPFDTSKISTSTDDIKLKLYR